MKNIQKLVKRVSGICLTAGLITACSEYDTNGLNMMRSQCSKSGASRGYASSCISSNLEKCLLRAAINGDLQRLNKLIVDGAKVDACDNIRWTALMHAVSHDREACVMALLRAGANVDNVGDFGNTALLVAVRDNKETCLLPLIEAGANLNAADDCDGHTVLINAAINGNEAFVRTLLAVNSTEAQNRVNVNAVDKVGCTALMHAARRGNIACVRTLLEVNNTEDRLNVNAMDKAGYTALMHAEMLPENEDCVNELLRAGVDVDAIDSHYGRTALMLAVGNEFYVKMLLGYGANVDIVDTCYGRNALMSAAYKGNTSCVNALIGAGANVDISDKDGNTALMNAAYKGRELCVRALLKTGADMNAVDGHYRRTALILAARNRHTSCVKALIEARVYENASNLEWDTALMWAEYNQDIECENMIRAASVFRNPEYHHKRRRFGPNW